MPTTPSKTRRPYTKRSPYFKVRGESRVERFAQWVTLEQVRDEKCRRHLRPFVERCFRYLVPSAQFLPNWHIDLVCEYLEAVEAGEIPRVIFNMPPRSLKSLICSVAFPAWLLGRNPSERILCASYSFTLSIDLSVKCRRIMQSDWYQRVFPQTVFAPDQNEKSKYETTQHGYRAAVSVGGSVTGLGGTYRILDDPLDPRGAYSEAERAQVLRWLDETWASRSDDPRRAREIVVMQRVHTKDPTDHLLRQGKWTLVSLPLEAPRRTVIEFPRSMRQIVREKGDLLHPEYLNREQVEDLKRRAGPYGFPAQYQQEPVPVGGGRVKLEWFPRYEALPDARECETVISLDTGYKKGPNANPTAMLVLQRHRKTESRTWYLVKVIKDRWTYPELKRAVIEAAQAFTPSAIIIEAKASGISLVQELLAETGLPVVSYDPAGDGSKMMRFEEEIPLLAAGRVSLPDPARVEAPWLLEFERNLASYPTPTEWDELDSLSQFLRWVRQREESSSAVSVTPISMTSPSIWRTGLHA